MKTLRIAMLLTGAALLKSRGEDARFFRIAGPLATTITSFSADGYVTWTNTPTNATFTVQTTSSLLNSTNWVDYIQVPATNPITIHRILDPNPPPGMALIPAGSFTMGDLLNDWPPAWGTNPEVPVHSVYVSAFYMDKYEVTKALWDEVYLWATNNGYSFEYGAKGKSNSHPAHLVSWYDCAKWCNARSEKEGRSPAYYTDAGLSNPYRGDRASPFVNWSNGYRLPTEAEWEKAARGGASAQRFPWGNTITHGQANYSANSSYAYDVSPTQGYHPTFNDGVFPYTSPVGYFAPNGYGLYDMAGNVFEWCWDFYSTYSNDSQTDPRGPASGAYRIYRDGSWAGPASVFRTAARNNTGQTYRSTYVGFRSALPAGQ